MARDLLGGIIPKVDAHMHTSLTDGYGLPEDYIQKSKENGLSAIAFTEHADNTSIWFEDYVGNRGKWQKMGMPMQVYVAAEVKIANPDGTLNLAIEKINQLDFLVGVLHRYSDSAGRSLSFKELGSKEAMDIDYQLSLALISNPMVDVFGHPGGVYSTYFGAYDYERLRKLIRFAAEKGKVVEINSKPRYRHVFSVILEQCLDLNCLISIGSDVHRIEEIGHVVSFLGQVLKTTRYSGNHYHLIQS